ncbi:histone H1.5-like isoform X3 [Microcaecilia unicolor]|uniref:Histone H1.5-like isoform X3 n=1 Tax=Microcaecilia unicolor TaxID=1415580 RepID=A0A6P7X5G0_9AMPH|nr:histone H1.5-like isoform X3 [Microcaecilia unicolor]
MAETAPAATAAPTAAPGAAKKKVKKPAGAAKARKSSSGPSVSELIVKAVSASKERSGMSLAALKKALAASGYDVEKNNSRLKLAVKSLVSKGSLLQTKGSGASGSFKLNKKPESTKKSAPKSNKPAVKKPKKGASVGVKKSPKRAKKQSAAATKKVAKSPKKPKAVKAKKVAKSPAKPKAVKPKKVAKSPAKTKAVKPKMKKSPAKAAKAKKGAPKKK